MASPAHSVPDTSLGLSRDEIVLLRQHQQVALAQTGGGSSRAASAASSQGRLLLDPSSLQALGYHFDRLMQAIQQRVQMVSSMILPRRRLGRIHFYSAMLMIGIVAPVEPTNANFDTGAVILGA